MPAAITAATAAAASGPWRRISLTSTPFLRVRTSSSACGTCTAG